MLGQRGDAEEHAKLIDAGFQLTTDTLNDVYYFGPYSRIVWLYEDKTWKANPEPEDDDLDKYLERIKSLVTAF
jgi:hypothetical protein